MKQIEQANIKKKSIYILNNKYSFKSKFTVYYFVLFLRSSIYRINIPRGNQYSDYEARKVWQTLVKFNSECKAIVKTWDI